MALLSLNYILSTNSRLIMKNNEKSNQSLIMCTTPLQMLIAEKIIELHKNSTTFDLLVVTNQRNKKFELYYDRLKNNCINSYYYIAASGIRSYSDLLLNFSKSFKREIIDKSYDNVYLASIDSIYFQYILSKQIGARIFTFDDGTANILKSSLYKVRPKNKYKKKVLSTLLGIKYDMQAIKDSSELHFTIYDNIPNIIAATRFIQLYTPKLCKYEESHNSTKRILLGQPLAEISKQLRTLDISKIIDLLDIDYYFPHPREELKELHNVEVIHSNLVFEDFIVKYLEKNKNIEIEVYSFISTANINIANLDRVKSIFIYNSLIYDRHQEFYTLASEKLNIPIIKL